MKTQQRNMRYDPFVTTTYRLTVATACTRWAYGTPKSASLELLLHFLFVWAQTLQDGKTLYSKKWHCFLFFDFNGFWGGNDVTRLTVKFKFQVTAKQINNFKRPWPDRNKCEKLFGKAQLVKELLSFDFWISRHFVTTFRNISTFQDAMSPFYPTIGLPRWGLRSWVISYDGHSLF